MSTTREAAMRVAQQQLEQEEKEEAAERRRQVFAVCVHMGLNVGALCTCITARPSVLTNLGGFGDAGEVARMVALLSSGVGATEFILNPIAGKVSDATGRKMFLLQSPAMSVILKLLVYLRPSFTTVALERCLGGACTTIGGSTACGSSLADIVDDPKELGMAYASLGTAAGFGVIGGPMLGALLGGEGNPRGAYLAGALLSAVQLIFDAFVIKEPLPVSQRVPLVPPPAAATSKGTDNDTSRKSPPSSRWAIASALVRAINPLKILDLFSFGRVVTALTSIAALQCFCEGKSISDLNAIYQLREARFDLRLRSLYLSCFGAMMTVSGMLGRETIRRFGMRGHTTLQNLMTALGFVVMGNALSPAAVFGTLPIYAFAMERRAATTSLAVKAAEKAGMGKGAFTAAFANLRAVCVGLAPLLYASAFARGIRMTPRRAGMGYFLAAAIALVCEAMHQTLVSSKEVAELSPSSSGGQQGGKKNEEKKKA